MPEIKLSNRELRYIGLFESLTGAVVKDCVIDERYNRVIFVVRPEDVGLAIGRGGEKVNQLKSVMKVNIEIVSYAETPEEIIKASLMPARVKNVRIINNPAGEKVAQVTVDPKDFAVAIGPKGKNINRARILAKRYFDISNIYITS
ncbi:MAG: NusA-like transcription termination signal-binding factor [Thermoprotei archaeon]|jgi:N utilization substance protein A